MAWNPFLPLLLLLLLSLLSLGQSSPLLMQKRDAPFNSVRQRLGRSRSGIRGDPPGKYFHESTVRLRKGVPLSTTRLTLT
jgi:hypothetical protein